MISRDTQSGKLFRAVRSESALAWRPPRWSSRPCRMLRWSKRASDVLQVFKGRRRRAYDSGLSSRLAQGGWLEVVDVPLIDDPGRGRGRAHARRRERSDHGVGLVGNDFSFNEVTGQRGGPRNDGAQSALCRGGHDCTRVRQCSACRDRDRSRKIKAQGDLSAVGLGRRTWRTADARVIETAQDEFSTISHE
jgi:hypothetical protein